MDQRSIAHLDRETQASVLAECDRFSEAMSSFTSDDIDAATQEYFRHIDTIIALIQASPRNGRGKRVNGRNVVSQMNALRNEGVPIGPELLRQPWEGPPAEPAAATRLLMETGQY